MKKTVLTLAAVALVSASASAKKPKTIVAETTPPVQTVVLANAVDSMSYALGSNVGLGFAKNLKTLPGGQYNLNLFIDAFTKAIKGDSLLMKEAFVQEFLNGYFAKAQARETEAKKAEGEKFLAENKTKEGVQTTASGLQYQVLVAKDGPKPKATDSVTVHYTGTLIDGTKFDSSVDRGEPITFPLNGVIPGWTEGVQLMSVGSKYKFVIPYTLGYGERGAGNGAIPGFATLVFEVELLNIKPFVEPAPAAVEPAKATVAPKANAKKPAATKTKSAPAAKK